MTITTISSREFNQDTSGAKKRRSKDLFTSLIVAALPMYCYAWRSTKDSPA